MESLFYGGSIFGNPGSEALLVQEGRIIHIGSLHECKSLAHFTPRKINLEGKLLLPAFTEGHCHLFEHAKSRLMIDLHGLKGSQIENHLKRYKAELNWQPPWILGGGWDNDFLAKDSKAAKACLDALWPSTPVAIFSQDYHTKICNSTALQIAGINKNSQAPAGGYIQRDERGMPTGLLGEAATQLLDAYTLLPPAPILQKAIRELINELYRFGFVAFHSFEAQPARDALISAQNAGMAFRLLWYFQADELEGYLSESKRLDSDNPHFHIGGLKLFADGSLGSNTAAMLPPDALDTLPDSNLRYIDDELYHQMTLAAQAGYPTSIHAIGSKAVRQAANSILRIRENAHYQKLKYRIEHLQAIHPADFELLKKADILASVQAIHLPGDIPTIQKLWHQPTALFYPFSTLQKAGIPLIFGSDAPIADSNPFKAIYAATHRKACPTAPAYLPDEALSVQTAIKAYSQNAETAWAFDTRRGALEVGNWADIMVIEDYTRWEPEYWLEARSLLTMFEGELMYDVGI